MENYFDYILEESVLPEEESVEDILTEYDLAINEFNSYIQESGLAIVAGVGISVALGGVIALIVKAFSNNQGASTANKAKRAANAAATCKKNGVDELEVSSVDEEKSNKILAVTDKLVEQYTQFIKEYKEKCSNIINKIKSGELTKEQGQELLGKSGYAILSNLPLLCKVGAATVPGIAKFAKVEVSADDAVKLLSAPIEKIKKKVPCDQAQAFCNNILNKAKGIIGKTKVMNGEYKQIRKLFKIQDGTPISDPLFEQLSRAVSSAIKNCYEKSSKPCEDITNAALAALTKVAPNAALELKAGSTIGKVADSFDKDIFGESRKNQKKMAKQRR